MTPPSGEVSLVRLVCYANGIDVWVHVQATSALTEENSKLANELREARAQIRNLELQVEAMKANAQRAAKALLDGGGL